MKAIEQRRSIRSYERKAVEAKKLSAVLEAGRLAPTARNAQNLRFLVAEGYPHTEKLQKVGEMQNFVAEAPVFIAVTCTSSREMICHEPTGTVDASIAMSFMLLEAVEQGLGMCWLGSFNDEKVAEYFQLEEGEKIVCASPLGYPAESPESRPRKAMEEMLLHWKAE